jgi:all-trans-8'-apo-beta-carotenal 15,15'-oxygenase
MTIAPAKPNPTRRWAKAIAHIPQEFTQQPLVPIVGAVPSGLRGSLYRNGPGRLSRGGMSMGHWFDGDGAVLAVQFDGSGQVPNATYRFVQTAAYQAESQTNRLMFSNYGTLPAWRDRWRGLKNAANTAVLALDDRLLALWEGGLPHALDLDSLATRGVDDLGYLPSGGSYSAHPSQDGQTGEIFNFGVVFGVKPQVNLYRSDRRGQLQRQGQFLLDRTPLLHDFALAGRYMIFCIPPVKISLPALALQQQCLSAALRWQPELGTAIVICDRETLAVVQRFQTDAWFQWHLGNGAELADGTVVVDYVRYEDLATNEFLREVASGDAPTIARSALWRLHLDPRLGKVISNQPRLDRQCEFPVVRPQDVGQPHSPTFLGLQHQATYEPNELIATIGALDAAGNLTIAPIPDGHYAVEPIYAADADSPDRGWLLTVIYNSGLGQSELWVFDADRLDAGPVCQLLLPEIIPPSFHGTWRRI